MAKAVFKFRGKTLSNLGGLLDEICRIANDAPEDAEDFLSCYIVNMMRINETTLADAEAIAATNIRYIAGYTISGNNRNTFEKIMQAFYPPVEVEV